MNIVQTGKPSGKENKQSGIVDNKASSTSFSVYLSEGGVISGREGRYIAKNR